MDERCRTSDLDIYDVGECALAGGRVYELIAPCPSVATPAPCSDVPDPSIVFEPEHDQTKPVMVAGPLLEVASR